MNRGNKKRKAIILAVFIIMLCPVRAFADPAASAATGPAQAANSETEKAYGPVTAQAETQTGATGPAGGISLAGEFPDAVKLETTLLKSDDPVALYANENMGLGGGRILMLRGTQTAHHNCLIVETAEGKRIVIDGGSGVNTEYLYRYLCENGGDVDAWLITHPHHDHAGALFQILSDSAGHPLTIRKLYCSTEAYDFVRQYDSEERVSFMNSFAGVLDSFDQNRLVRSMEAGMTFQVGSAEVRVINRPYQIAENAGNNASVCYRITLGGKRLMILGDIGKEASEKMISEHAAEEMKADILQLAHHGQYGGSQALYTMIAPTTALWCSSENIWKQTRESVGSSSSLTPQVTMSWMRQLGVQRNYSMSVGNWVLK